MRKKADQAMEKYLGGLGGGDSRATPIPVINVNGAHTHHTQHLTNGNHSLNTNDAGNHKIRIKLQTPKSTVARNKADGIHVDGERPDLACEFP